MSLVHPRCKLNRQVRQETGTGWMGCCIKIVAAVSRLLSLILGFKPLSTASALSPHATSVVAPSSHLLMLFKNSTSK